MKKLIFLPALVSLFISCASNSSAVVGSVGETKSQILTNWGTPIRTLENNNNGEILVYADQIFINNGSEGMAGKNYWNYNYVYINKEGKVTSTKQEKQNFPPQAIDSQKMLGMNLLTSN
ncbi:hypothetical protein [Flavobacterium olei]|uniref:hypothetical protein n=1 Tax=Flavobacterium olei TaxID=1886782 RepID=UPI0032195E80